MHFNIAGDKITCWKRIALLELQSLELMNVEELVVIWKLHYLRIWDQEKRPRVSPASGIRNESAGKNHTQKRHTGTRGLNKYAKVRKYRYLGFLIANDRHNGKHNRNSILVSNSFFLFKLKAATEKQQRLKMGLLWPKIIPFCFWCMHIQWQQLWKWAPTYNTFDSTSNIWNGYGNFYTWFRIIYVHVALALRSFWVFQKSA